MTNQGKISGCRNLPTVCVTCGRIVCTKTLLEEKVLPMSNDYTIKIEGYTTSNPRISGNEIWIDVEPKWISVKDRLPEIKQKGICYLDDDKFVYSGKYYFFQYWGKGSWDVQNDTYSGNGNYHGFIPTHWMPLPKPPEE